MANEMSEPKSILRQLLLSNDESDSFDISQRKRKITDDNEKAEKRGRVIFSSSDGPRTMVLMEHDSNEQQISPTVTIPLQNANVQQQQQQHQQRLSHEHERRGFFFDANEMSLGQDCESFYFNQFEMLMHGTSNNSSHPKEDDLPVTREMRRHYLQQLQERLTQDSIGLPT